MKSINFNYLISEGYSLLLMIVLLMKELKKFKINIFNEI